MLSRIMKTTKQLTKARTSLKPSKSNLVTDVKRGTPFEQKMKKSIKYAKYFSAGTPIDRLSKEEQMEPEEAHYDGNGNMVSPELAHYGHVTLNGKRFNYQKQHILHSRLVKVGLNPDGTPHMIPTDSRFKDRAFLDKKIPPEEQFVGKNGKRVGLILVTTPTKSTSAEERQLAFTHHVDENNIKHAKSSQILLVKQIWCILKFFILFFHFRSF